MSRWNWGKIVGWSVGLLIVALLVGGFWFGNQHGSWLQVFYGQKAKDGISLDVGTQLLIEAVKWGLGLLGLAAVGLYNLYRADLKEKTTRQAQFVNSYSQARIDALNKVHDQLHLVSLALSEVDSSKNQVEYQDRLKIAGEAMKEMCRLSTPYGGIPEQIRQGNDGHLTNYLYAESKTLLHAVSDWWRLKISHRTEDEVSQGFERCVEIQRRLFHAIPALLLHERKRMFLCSTLPCNKWPAWVSDDLPFVDQDKTMYLQALVPNKEDSTEANQETF